MAGGLWCCKRLVCVLCGAVVCKSRLVLLGTGRLGAPVHLTYSVTRAKPLAVQGQSRARRRGPRIQPTLDGCAFV